MAAACPKQFLKIGFLPVLTVTLKSISRIPFISGIVLVVSEDSLKYVQENIIAPYRIKKIESVVAGGATRQESVFNGLTALIERMPHYVMIHDGVRPFCPNEVWQTVYNSLGQFQAVIPAIRSGDTLKEVSEKGIVVQTLDRDKVWSVQTPQGFQFNELYNAHVKMRKTGKIITDDSMVMEHAGYSVKVVQGHKDNIKLTTPEDLRYAEYLLNHT
ncbi:2-C-methyl-D-erythritol 4-phosphate cytidylyltransferase [bacterium]|nr:2-C-methyl-D-erythritol 4-phosphate cytidylyltransferase [bacterium]MCP5463156.1 2-C-methyl-D-erythritol 4-phosphate cytidylyltransferase [bacterium]